MSSLLGKTSQQNQFKLDALTDEVFGLLEAVKKNHDQNDYLLLDKATSLDCLVLGYLSLALYPDVPRPWLREALQSKAPRLVQYTERMRRQCFNDPQLGLHWKKPTQRQRLTSIGSTLLTNLADATPILRDIRANNRLILQQKSTLSGSVEGETVSEYARSKKTDLYVSIASVGVGISALVGYMFYVNILSFGREEEEEEKDIEPLQVSDFLSPV